MTPLSASSRACCSSSPLLPAAQPQGPMTQRVQSSFRPEATRLEPSFSTHEFDAANSEVYLTAREFKSWGGDAFQQLPRSVKEFIVDVGVCHYLVLVKSPDGSVRQWDFGPCGGDVHVALPGCNLRRTATTCTPLESNCCSLPTEPLFDSMNMADSRDIASARGVPGEIREDLLPALPSHAPVIHIGRTTLTANEIREFNAKQPQYYLLHENDCRHYTNNLVQHMTGMEKGTSVFLHQQYLEKVKSYPLQHPHRPLIHAMQALTDVSNWESVRCVTSLAAAALTSLFGARLWGGLRAAPSRLAAGLASRTFSRLVKPRAGTVLTAAAPRPSLPALTPVAVGAASITASKVGVKHFGSRGQPWRTSREDAAMSGMDLTSNNDLRPRQLGNTEGTKLGNISRVSQSVGAALAKYAATPLSQHLVHILKQKVSAVRRMKPNSPAALGQVDGSGSRLTTSTEQGADAGKMNPSALQCSGASKAGAGTLMVRRPVHAATPMHGPFSQVAAVWSQVPMPGTRDASASQRMSSSQDARPACQKHDEVPSKLPSPARFFTRGSKTFPLLSLRDKAGSTTTSQSQQQASPRDAACTAFSAALQQQAARWYL